MTFQNDSAHLGRGFKAAIPMAPGVRVIVCGGRDYTDRERVFHALDAAHARRPIKTVVHGGAPGADSLAQDWARERGIPVERWDAAWDKFGKSAGPRRNQQMADAGAAGCIAFPGGAGTADMTQRAIEAGIPVWRPWG